jgi:hypothetical protein
MAVYHGIYRAVVEQDIDPLGNGRFAVKIKQPPSTETGLLTWVTYTTPCGGVTPATGAGFFMPPRKGSVVEIAFENGDSQSPIYICTLVGVDKNKDKNVPPVEAADTYQFPGNRIIKTDSGHSLELDDRDKNQTGVQVAGVRLRSAKGKSLELSDGLEEVVLHSGGLGHILRMSPGELVLKSRKQGLFINDNEANGGLWLKGLGTDDQGFILGKGIASLQVSQEIGFDTDTFNVISNSATNFQTSAFDVTASASAKISSGGNINLASMGRLAFSSVGGMDVLLTGGNALNPSNFIVRSPVPGIPMISGMMHCDFTPPATLCLRVGAPLPSPIPPGFIPSTPDLGDVLATARLAIGGVTGGSVALEGLLGGIYISAIPFPLPGTCIIPPIKKPIIYAPIPTQLEPMVRGFGLWTWLTTFMTWLTTFLGSLSAMAATPAWGLAGGYMPVLSPAVSTFLAAQATSLNSLLMPQLLAPHPLGFLSQISFVS